MSDPVTNVEIEDVLSSIRKLVSDGDKARTRDPAPVEHVDDAPDAVVEPAPGPAESKPEKLVLSPAFMVVGSQDHEDSQAEPQENDDEPLNLSDPVWDNAPSEDTDFADHGAQEEGPEAKHTEDAHDAAEPDEADENEAPSTDRSSLVETIAELEAAVSSDTQDFEPDGSEEMGETIAWPGAIVRQPDAIEDAEIAEDATDAAPQDDQSDVAEDAPVEDNPTFTHHAAVANDDAPETAEPDAGDVFEDDDLDDLLDVGGVTLDEDALRQLVSDVVREELTGPLGERITRNVRKLVRREIYRILSSQEFD